MASLTPMMQQYLTIHEEAPDALLFFRLGDFYEMFFDDAITGSRVLDLVLTGRDCGLDEKAPMCGVPHQSVDGYVAKLVERGYKVAICEQVSDPDGKGIVKREITRIITSGTIVDGKSLPEDQNNYIASVYYSAASFAVTVADVSTGECFARLIARGDIHASFLNYIAELVPGEVLVNSVLYADPSIKDPLESLISRPVNLLSAAYFAPAKAEEAIVNQLHVFALSSTGIGDDEALVRSAGALFTYLKETQKNALAHLNAIHLVPDGAYMPLDAASRRNLEITRTMRSGDKQGSLLAVLDKTSSPVGARTLRRWVCEPLVDPTLITGRHEAVEELAGSLMLREDTADILKNTSDISRLSSKISYRTVNGRDLLALKETLLLIPRLQRVLMSATAPLLRTLADGFPDLSHIAQLIYEAISDECTANMRDGKLIAAGYSEELDEIKELRANTASVLAAIEARERETTGIKNLKVAYNKVFGYYFEVSKGNLSLVPDRFIRKQTLVNAERFYTEELKATEEKLLSAYDEIVKREVAMFEDIVTTVSGSIPGIQSIAQAVGEIDALNSLAETAFRNHYVRPSLNFDGVLDIKGGRHPVVEQIIPQSSYIKNDIYADNKKNRLLIITGPNMAGKSTYIRQAALICLMNQTGSFVPADDANLCVVDRIFTRVGASDDLASGQSTFMVEMSEVSNILKNATKDSLLILDEVGRGTSTYDGLSIASSVLEHIAGERIGAKCLFATHYHELTELEGTIDGVVNFSINIEETPDGVVFTHRIVPGPADRSYGIEVAKLAGLPPEVIQRASELLLGWENEKPAKKSGRKRTASASIPPQAATLFNYKTSNVIELLRKLDINELTPLEVVNAVARLQNELE